MMTIIESNNPKKEEYTFSYQELEHFLSFAKEIAPIGPMRDYTTKKGKYIILRQDVDLDIYPSYEVYKLEKKLGITSTFFILITAHTYNPQSSKIRKMLKEMAAEGFEIGLHFDPLVYGNINLDELEKKVKIECKILEDIINEPIHSIALHNPSLSGKYPIIKGYINAYSKELFSNEQYLSDSMRVDPELHPFRGKNPYKFVRNAKKYPLQIALHPEQFLEKGGDYLNTITRHTSNITNDILHEYLDTLSSIRRDKLYRIK